MTDMENRTILFNTEKYTDSMFDKCLSGDINKKILDICNIEFNDRRGLRFMNFNEFPSKEMYHMDRYLEEL